MAKAELAKGVRDFDKKDAAARNFVVSTLKKVFERYGYTPLQTPILERKDVILAKGGDEIKKEIFLLKDQGDRELALRFDLTVPLARYIACNPMMPMPLKRYEIGPVFRDGPAQPEQGRYRMFFQADIDIVGVKEMTADAEIVAITEDAVKELGLGEVEIYVNNRKLLNGIMEAAGIPENKCMTVILSIDKLGKFGEDAVRKELKEKGFNENQVNTVLELISDEKKLRMLDNKAAEEGLKEIDELMGYCKKLGLKNVIFNPSLARGLEYYTGTVFEVYPKCRSIINSAITAGGRYDEMIGNYCGSKQGYPAVGISFGVERLTTVVQKVKEMSETTADIYLIPIKSMEQTLEVAQKLRAQGLNVDMDLKGNKAGKALDYANKKGYAYAGFVGEEELEKDSINIREMKSGNEELVKISKVKEFLK